MGRRAKSPKGTQETKQSPARKPPKNQGARARDLEKRLAEALKREAEALRREAEAQKREAEALEQQTATAEILRVISQSPTDIQPVLSAVAESAAQLCQAYDVTVFRVEGDVLRLVAHHGPVPATPQLALPIGRDTVGGRSILEARTIQVADLQIDDGEYPLATSYARKFGHRTLVSVPLLREGVAVGAIQLRRTEVAPFADTQIALLQTFADQAVIAIENVRLFKELETRNRDLTRALDRETATSEILRVISSSPTDVQPVFDAIVRSAVTLCGAILGAIYRRDGGLVRLVGLDPRYPHAEEVRAAYPAPVTSTLISCRAIHENAIIQLPDTEIPGVLPPDGLRLARLSGFRSVVAVPMRREGEPIGATLVGRPAVGAFPDEQIGLLQAFADQAVIAIENVRLFNETKEALEQQTATAEILRVIASSPTDVQPVFDAIAKSTARLCSVEDVTIVLVQGDVLWAVASTGRITGMIPNYNARRVPVGRTSVAGRVIVDRQTLHIDDLAAVSEDEFPDGRALQRMFHHRTILATPLLREDAAVGAIVIYKYEVRPFSERQRELLKTFADQAVIAIENMRLFNELQASNRELTTALDQQTATSDILRVISQSPTDLQPVFDAIVRNAVKLCAAAFGGLQRISGDWMTLDAQCGVSADEMAILQRDVFPLPITRESATGRAVVDRAVVHIHDIREDPQFGMRRLLTMQGFRTILAVPMIREGVPIGALALWRREVRPFTDTEVGLVQTFADQAVIAIENVRLFTELQEKNHALTKAHAQVTESLEQQMATSDILRVISSSPTDVQPVFDAVAESARQLCNGEYCVVESFDGERLHFGASDGLSPEGLAAFRQALPRPVSEDNAAGRAVLRRMVAQIPDVLEDPTHGVRNVALAANYRSAVAVPMLRDGQPIGAIVVARSAVGLFPERQVALLQTFADQAVIAIENVRLFKELEARNRDLTEALEQQTATAEILRVISRSQTDVQPVFDTIVKSAVRLCDGLFGTLLQFDGELLHHVAQHNYTPEALEAALHMFPARPTRAFGAGRAILERAVVHIPDVEVEPKYQHHVLRHAIGWRSGLFVPMLREGASIGVIVVGRAEAGPFSDNQIELLKTFADQAVIAIENVRLFNELEARNRDLTATSEILQVISRSPTDAQPVFDTIAERAMRLCDAATGIVGMFDGALIHVRALANVSSEGVDAIHQAFPTPPSRGSVGGRVILTGDVVQIPDVLEDPEYQFIGQARTVRFRGVLGVPMLHQGRAIGVITVGRPEPGTFSEEQILLLKTFADQAVIAIENVRLFKELQARTGELTESVEQLTALGEVSHALSSTLDVETVLDTIVSRATQLAGADGCAISEYDDATAMFHVRATHGIDTALIGTLRAMPLRKGEGVGGRAAETREPIQIADISVTGAYQSPLRDVLIGAGFRAVLSVPLLREEQIIGSLSLSRKAPGEYSPEVIEVLKTFATQSALAIQNARLFREIADKSTQLETASRHKSEFLANMSHELRTPLNAIIGFSEVLVDRMFGELNEKQEEYLKDIYASGQHLLSLINDILDLSKIEAGRMELEATDFDLPSAIDNALTLVRERAIRRRITLGRTIDDRLGMLRGDERKVKQVLLNLLSNALKFTPEGGRIDVSAHLQDGAAEIAVADTGVGIAPEDQEVIFEEFRQVGTADKKVEGTGLGLALSRKFIELHGGRIWVKSEVGHGSTFTFALPVRCEPNDREARPH